MKNLSAWSPKALALLRIVTGLLFLEHATQKFLGFPIPFPIPLGPQFVAAGIIEAVAGTLIVLGLFTRPAAFIAAGEMAVAYFWVHFPQGFWPAANKGEAAILFCFIFFYLVFAGPGAWSLDTVLGRRRRSPF
jgi:putative oxidoreductase